MKKYKIFLILFIFSEITFAQQNDLQFQNFEKNLTVQMLLEQNANKKITFLKNEALTNICKDSSKIEENFDKVIKAFDHPLEKSLHYASDNEKLTLLYDPKKEENKNKKLASEIMLLVATLGLKKAKNVLQEQVKIEECSKFDRLKHLTFNGIKNLFSFVGFSSIALVGIINACDYIESKNGPIRWFDQFFTPSIENRYVGEE